MDIQKTINALIEKDLRRCEKLRSRLSGEIQHLEKGSVVCRNGTYNWFRRVDGVQSSRKIDNDALLFRLRKRQFIKRTLPLLDRRIKNNIRYLENDTFYDPAKINSDLPVQYRGLQGMEIFLDGDINPEDWPIQDYEKGDMYKEGKMYKVDSEISVRSKSEMMILMRLQESGFCVKYEPKLELNSKVFCPDFEVLLPACRRLIYYEHFGMIDNPVYAKRAFEKLKTYAENGILLGYNLVITFETQDCPLTLADIDAVIEQLKCLDN